MANRFWRAAVLCLALAALVLIISVPARVEAGNQVRYVAIDLGTLGGLSAEAWAINSQTQVVGAAHVDTNAGIVHAFIWQNGMMKDLGTLGGFSSVAHGINDKGQIVGDATTVEWSGAHACLWDSGRVRDLNPPGAGSSSAMSINSQGQVVGSYIGGDFVQRACIWNGGVMTDLGLPSNPVSLATSINDKSEVVGYYWPDATTSCAFLWSNGAYRTVGQCQQLPLVAYATGINNHSQVSGISYPPFLFDRGTIIPLDIGSARGLNDSAEIAGGAYTASGRFHAILWREGVVTDLDADHPRDSEAFAVNSRSEAVGFAAKGDGYNVAVLWMPAR